MAVVGWLRAGAATRDVKDQACELSGEKVKRKDKNDAFSIYVYVQLLYNCHFIRVE